MHTDTTKWVGLFHFANWSLGLWSCSLTYPQRYQQHITVCGRKRKLVWSPCPGLWSLILMPVPLSLASPCRSNVTALVYTFLPSGARCYLFVSSELYAGTIKTLPPILPLCFIKWVCAALICALCAIPGKHINLIFNRGPILNERLEKFPWPAPSLVATYLPSNQEPVKASKGVSSRGLVDLKAPFEGRGVWRGAAGSRTASHPFSAQFTS